MKAALGDSSPPYWRAISNFLSVAHGAMAHPESMKTGGPAHLDFSGLQWYSTSIFKAVTHGSVEPPREYENRWPCSSGLLGRQRHATGIFKAVVDGPVGPPKDNENGRHCGWEFCQRGTARTAYFESSRWRRHSCRHDGLPEKRIPSSENFAVEPSDALSPSADTCRHSRAALY
jgi:hypothetical protein